jgi:hypothetical protein
MWPWPVTVASKSLWSPFPSLYYHFVTPTTFLALSRVQPAFPSLNRFGNVGLIGSSSAAPSCRAIGTTIAYTALVPIRRSGVLFVYKLDLSQFNFPLFSLRSVSLSVIRASFRYSPARGPRHSSSCWSLTIRGNTLRVFEKRVLRGVHGPKSEQVTRHWRKLLIEELHNWYSPPSIIRIIKSRRMRWAGHVALMRRRGIHIAFGWGNQKQRDH